MATGGERIGEGFVEARLDTSRLDRDAEEMQRSLQARFDRVGQRMQQTGRTLTRRVTAPVVALGTAIVRTAASFEQSMNRVGALTGATGSEFDRLNERAQELGRTTQFSASQAADGMGFLAQAGFETNEIYDAMPGVLNLAAAGQLELAESADIASNVLQGMNMDVSELDRLMDVMAATATSSNTDIRQLGDALSFVAPIAAGAGVELEEIAAAIGLMGDAGIQSTRAGTSLRMAISQMINPTAAAADALDRLGVNTQDAEGNMLPLHDIMRQLEDSGASTADMMTIFGQRAGPAMQALLAQGSDALQTFTGDLEDSGGTAERIAERQMEGLNGALARMRSATEGAAIAIAESGLLDMLARGAERVANWFQRLAETNPAVLRFGVLLAGVAAAAGPVMWIIGSMLRPFGQLVGLVQAAGGATVILNRAMSTLLIGALNPMVLAVGAAAAAVAGLIWWLNQAGDEHVAVSDSVEALADSLELDYSRAQAAGQDLAEGQERTAQQFMSANAEMIQSLRDMSDEAAQATLIQMGFELVQGGVDPDEAFASIQRLADAAGIELPLELSPDDLADTEAAIEATIERIRHFAERAEGFWNQATGGLGNLQDEMEEVGALAGRMFDEGDILGALELLSRAQDELADSTDEGSSALRSMFRAFGETADIDGFTLRVDNLDQFLREASDGTALLTDENRRLTGLFFAAMESGMDLGEALEFIDDVMARGGDTAEGLGEDVDELADAFEGAEPSASDLAQAVADGEMSMDEARTAAANLGIDVSELEGAYAELTGEVQTATEALGEWESAQRAISDPVFRARQAMNRYGDAQDAVNKLVEEGKEGTEEFNQALIDEFEAAEDAEFALRNLSASHEDGATSVDMIRGRADELVESMGLSGEAADLARDLFVELFDQANELPEVKEIDVNVTGNAAGALGTIRGQLDRLPTSFNIRASVSGMTASELEAIGVRAEGGPVVAGRPYIVGEDGPELVTFSQDGFVHSAPETADLLSGLMLDGQNLTMGTDGSAAPSAFGMPTRNIEVRIVNEMDGRAIGESRVVLDAMSGALRSIERDTAGLGPL